MTKLKDIKGLLPEKYQIIYADPPWQYGKWNNSPNPKKCFRGGKPLPTPYNTMSVEEIKNLTVESIADNNCLLFLWTTNKYLPYSFDVLKSWGFRYAQTLVWCKKPMGLGLGGLFAPSTEFLLLGRRGKTGYIKRRPSTWFQFKRQSKHSKKPNEFRDLISGLGINPKIELFAREKTPGWDAWGNEVESDIEL